MRHRALKAFLISIVFGSCVNAMAQKRVGLVSYYPSGRIMSQGKLILPDSAKDGRWRNYSDSGYLASIEKWKRGAMLWALYFNSEHRKTRRIDKDGKVTLLRDCGCK
jgi:hypothetical protein